MDQLTELAKMFKERENVFYKGGQVGIVLSPPPEIKVSAFDGKVILYKEHLIISAHVLAGYKRDLELTTVNVENQSTSEGDLTLRNPPLPQSPATTNEYSIMNLAIPNSTVDKLSGQMEYKNTLVKGDEVILLPSQDEQTYFLVDKVVRLP